MAKTIRITPALERDIVAFCRDELNYHINESGCAEEYASEIKAQIKLLALLGYEGEADGYNDDFKKCMKKYRENERYWGRM